MGELRKKKTENFTNPTQLPRTSDEAEAWQKNNASWWEENPMRYDWKSPIPHEKFSREFFNEIDNRFFLDAREYLDPHFTIPFDEFIHFDSLKDKKVLEIGVGNGSHAQLLARYSKSFTGIDITEYAATSTKTTAESFWFGRRCQENGRWKSWSSTTTASTSSGAGASSIIPRIPRTF